MSKQIIGLGLESSCDETSAALVVDGKKVLSNKISSQIDLHKEYNGVVPEIASRAHLEIINNIIADALNEAGLDFKDLDYVAATNRPGLVGALLIGLQSAKAISYTLGIPLIAVNHLEAHLYAPWLENKEPGFPHIGLLVSGGNTALYLVHAICEMELLGKTSDDAVGEAFDKVAKFIGLEYPGGPIIDKLARQAKTKKVFFPKILAAKNTEYTFSYSGLKTAVINYIKQNPGHDPIETVYSFQERALELLKRRVFQAARRLQIKDIVVAGGVAANSRLRELLQSEKEDNEKIFIPSPILCTDNGAMIAGLAYHYFVKGQFNTLDVDVSSRA